MFQANVIHGSEVEFNALLYPQLHQNTLNYIQNGIAQLSNTLVGKGNQLFDYAKQKYMEINSHANKIRAMNALAASQNVKNENIIYEIKSIESCRQATLTMQRWVMAEPTIRKMYHDQRCDGFSNTYIDLEPGKVGEQHYDYRRVMTGVVNYESEDHITNTYLEDLRDGDRDLESIEQLSILNSWEITRLAVAMMNEDPTDPLGGTL